MIYRIKNNIQKYIMTLSLNNINFFVNKFLNTNNLPQDKWNSKSNQQELKKLFNNNIKDPNTPKRAKSAYLIFCEENRESIHKELGHSAKITEVTRILGSKWRELNNDPKRSSELQNFKDLAAKDKERFLQEMKNFQPTTVSETETKTKTKTKQEGPKRAKTAYLYFCDANRVLVNEELSKKLSEKPNAKEIIKELGNRWNLIKDTEKSKEYFELWEKDKIRYNNEKESYLNTKNQTNISNSVNDYKTFCAKRRPELKKEYPDKKANEITKIIASEWKNFSKENTQENKEEFTIGVLA